MINNVSFIGIINIMREFDGGRGTEANPYRIVKVRHLRNAGKYSAAHYKLENDIVFTDEFEEDGEYYNNGSLWIPISNFNGVFDGQGYKIENLKSKLTGSGAGSFIRTMNVSGSALKNVYFKNIYVSGDTSASNSGGIIGTSNTNCTIEGIYVDGFIRLGHTSGGLFGRGGHIKRCATNITIYGYPNPQGGYAMGGLGGGSSTTQIIDDCYTRGILYGYYQRGAIYGSTFGTTVNRSMTYMTLAHSSNMGVGIDESWHRAGIISSRDYSTSFNVGAYDCFFDRQLVGTTYTWANTGFPKGNALYTNQMKYPYADYTDEFTAVTGLPYSTWDFDTVWAHDVDGDINNGYPYLRGVTPLPSSEFDYSFDFKVQ